ncbi:hypothetical protein QE152_g38875 [Popillia japonica]|uniref:Uncharacterized protein n=1 Tax=Popillia japonica TaxID=7064 RepID=A0AAW1HVD6_POPJA
MKQENLQQVLVDWIVGRKANNEDVAPFKEKLQKLIEAGNNEDVAPFKEKLQKLIEDEQLSVQQLYNCDETELQDAPKKSTYF